MWHAMTAILPPATNGLASLSHFSVNKTESVLSCMRREYVPTGSYVRLHVSGKLMMSDTSMEKRTNQGAVLAATGDVLIAGLGIGLIVLPMALKESVKSITVVEKHPDVISMIEPHLSSSLGENSRKLSVTPGDIFEWMPPKGVKYDCIYFDIWPDICTDNLGQMATLHQRFKGRLKGNRWMDSWCRNSLKAKK